MSFEAWPDALPCGQVDFSLSGGTRSGGQPAGDVPAAIDGETFGPFWRARVAQLPLLSAVQIAAARALEGRLDGGAAPVLINVCLGDMKPQVLGGAAAVATLTADAAAGATSLQLALSGAYLPLRGGEWLGYVHADPVGERGYMIAEISGGTEAAPIVKITPPLRAAIASGQALSFSDVKVPMHLVDGFDMTVDLGRFSGVEATFEEWFEEEVVLALRPLSLSPHTIVSGSEEDTLVGTILGRTTGSTLTLTDDAGGRFKLVEVDGVARIYAGSVATDIDLADSHDITVTETLGGYINSPRANVLTIDVTAPAVATYQRVVVRSEDGYNYAFDNGWSTFGVAELEMYDAPGGPDLTTGETAVASGSFDASHTPDKAIDNNNATSWVCPNGYRLLANVGVQFAIPKAVNRIALRALPTQPSLCGRLIGVHGSNGGAATPLWFDLWSRWSGGERRESELGDYSIWKCQVIATNEPVSGTTSCAALIPFAEGVELEVLGASGSSRYVASFFDTDSLYDPDLAFDGNPATAWVSKSGSNDQYLTFKVAGQLVDRIDWTARNIDGRASGTQHQVSKLDQATGLWVVQWTTAPTSQFLNGQTKTLEPA